MTPLASLQAQVKQDLRGLVDDARQRLGERARSELDQALDRLRGAPPPRAPAAPARVPATPVPLPIPRPTRRLRLRVAGGRTVEAQVTPAPARQDDVAALAFACAANEGAAFQLLGRHARAIAELERATEELRAAQQELEQRADVALVELLDRLVGLGRTVRGVRRAQAVGAGAARRAARDRRAMSASLRRQAAEVRSQKFSAVVQSVQSAAYGQRGSLLAPNNLLLAGNQLLWSFVDPILRTLGLWDGAGPSPLAGLAPLGNLLTGAAVLAPRQGAGGRGV